MKQVIFWGTRGSLPTSITHANIRAKISSALLAANGRSFRKQAELDAFIEALPFAVHGTFGGNSSCVEIVTDGPEHFICDVGTGARPLGQSKIARYGVPNPQVYHLFISHLHWDHLMGIPFFTPIYIPGNRIIIHGCHSGLEEAFRRQMRAPNFPVDYTQAGADIEFDLMTPGKAHFIGGINVTPKLQKHPGDSYGYRFESIDKTVVYSTDSEREIYRHIISRNPEHDFEPTLDRVREVCELLGDPQRAYRVVCALEGLEATRGRETQRQRQLRRAHASPPSPRGLRRRRLRGGRGAAGSVASTCAAAGSGRSTRPNGASPPSRGTLAAAAALANRPWSSLW